MADFRERIIGALALMEDSQAAKVWTIIQSTFAVKEKTWDDIPSIVPDSEDLQMLKEIKENPDCNTFISAEKAYGELGLG